MLIKVVQRFPNYVSGFSPQESECTTLDDIESIPFVQRWVNDKTFYRLCKSTHKNGSHLLMCETNKGEGFWAIAYLYGDIDQLNLPEWKK
jgi:hypothetical protein